MSFIDIKNPKKRDQIVQDYIKTLAFVRQKAENEKAQGLEQRIKLEKQYNPIINATKESANRITDELKNNRAIAEGQKRSWRRDFTQPAIEYYLNLKKNQDMYYGIQKINGHYKMGEATVILDNKSNIYVDNERFEGTPGLWALVMLNQPNDYTSEDLHRYEDLVEKTQVIDNPITRTVNDRPKMTSKYKNILSQFEEAYESPEEEDAKLDSDNEETPPLEGEEGGKGQGITYLPSNISGLLDRLKLVYAERQAGNISATTNEIVGILDELLRIKYINRREYNAVCEQLSC